MATRCCSPPTTGRDRCVSRWPSPTRFSFFASCMALATPELKRHGNVLKSGHGGNKVKGLENDADGVAPEGGEGIFILVLEPRARTSRVPDVALEAGDEHEQGGFAGPGRANDTDGLAGVDAEVDASQDFDVSGAAGKGESDVFQENGGLGHGPTHGDDP